jgi:hypothetical protein
MNLILDCIVAARARIADPAHWTQKAYARTADKEACGPNSPNAVCWCAAAALECHNVISPAHLLAELGALPVADPDMFTLTSWNDSHTHAEVLELFDRAIVAAQDPARPTLNPPYFLRP